MILRRALELEQKGRPGLKIAQKPHKTNAFGDTGNMSRYEGESGAHFGFRSEGLGLRGPRAHNLGEAAVPLCTRSKPRVGRGVLRKKNQSELRNSNKTA
jgi:hypothetical protein